MTFSAQFPSVFPRFPWISKISWWIPWMYQKISKNGARGTFKNDQQGVDDLSRGPQVAPPFVFSLQFPHLFALLANSCTIFMEHLHPRSPPCEKHSFYQCFFMTFPCSFPVFLPDFHGFPRFSGDFRWFPWFSRKSVKMGARGTFKRHNHYRRIEPGAAGCAISVYFLVF